MREETEFRFRPKRLAEIDGRPIVWHIMKFYAHHGFRSFVVCLGYRGEMIKDYFLNYEAMSNDLTITLGRENHTVVHSAHEEQGFEVTLADTGASTMAGGRIKRVERYIDIGHVHGDPRVRCGRYRLEGACGIPSPSRTPDDPHRGQPHLPVRADGD